MVDKGCVCNSLFHYPAHMTFFTTPELLEIGDIPFPSTNAKPNRNEALQYYRLVAATLAWMFASTIASSGSPARTAPLRCTPWTALAAAGASGAQAGHRHRLL